MSKMAEDVARRKAEEIWGGTERRKAEALSERQLAQRAEATKTARLRELRLAKEAAARQAGGETRVSRRRATGPKRP